MMIVKRGSAALMAAVLWAIAGCATTSHDDLSRRPAPVFPEPKTFAEYPSHHPTLPPARPPLLSAPTGPRVPRGWIPPGGISDKWKYIVVHHSGSDSGNAAEFDRYHREVNHWDELGYHFVIGNGHGSLDGMIEVGPRWTKQKHGAHCKTPGNDFNEHGIGICLVGDFRFRGPSRAQMASLDYLVRFLMARCNIPPRRVVTHKEVTHRTVCPGVQFPAQAWRRTLADYPVATVMR